MEFPLPPYEPLPINGFPYPSREEIGAHLGERGDRDRNVLDLWTADQVWTQTQVENNRYGFAQQWPAWADDLIRGSRRPDGTVLTGGRAFQGPPDFFFSILITK